MKDSFAPGLIEHVTDHVILWFQRSNRYILTEKSLYSLIEAFLASKSKSQFDEAALDLGYDAHQSEQFFKEIGQFLEDSNTIAKADPMSDISFSNDHRHITRYYQMDDQAIVVHYESEDLKSLVHPQLEHLEIPGDKKPILSEFDIYTYEDNYVLFKNEVLLGSWPSKDYHLLQGKFAMHLICALHDNEELDWIGTFHASTVVKNDQAVMVIGDSGKGKSTFTALLLAYGYEVLADDLTPILANDCLVYPYPGAISLKAGSFEILNNRLPNFKELTEHYINPYKGYVKYVGAPKSKGYLKGYPCNTIVRINYESNSETKLETISIAEALDTLIPESWLAPKQENAKQFLNWIKHVRFYELSYSNSEEAIRKFSKLRKE